MKTNIIRVALFTPGPNNMWGLPILLWGDPGVAKSAILKQLAAEYNLPIEILSPACRGEGAFGVTPVPVNGRMTYPRPDWTDKFDKAGRGIVFVDEMNLAAQHFAGALLGLLSDRVLGSYQLPPGVRVVAAANPISIAAASGGWDLSAPAANRVGHLNWPCPDVKAWTDWLLGDGLVGEVIDSEDEETRVTAVWGEAWGRARNVVAGFLSSHSTHLHAMPTGGSEEMSKAWPSPRSWESATRALAAADIYKLPPVERDEFVNCFIGDGAGGELLEWLSKADLPDSAKLLDGEVQWNYNPARLDAAMAVFGSAAATCIGTEDAALRKRRAAVMWELLARAADTAPDIIVKPSKALVSAKLFANAIKTLGKLQGVLKAAGITEHSVL